MLDSEIDHLKAMVTRSYLLNQGIKMFKASLNLRYFKKSFSLLLAIFIFVSFCSSASAEKSSSHQALDKYLKHISKRTSIREPTLGIELEGIMPSSSREECFNKLTEIMSSEVNLLVYPGWTLESSEYQFSTRRGDPRYGMRFTFKNGNGVVDWHLKEDGSIVPGDGHYGIELVSPILENKKEVKNFIQIVKILKKHGFTAEPSSAAFQIHVGFSEQGPLSKVDNTSSEVSAEILLLTWIFSKIEVELMELFAVNPKRQKFTMATPKSVIAAIESYEKIDSKFSLYNFVESHYKYRYWALNLHSLFQFGTAEIRFANSTTDIETMNLLIDFARKLYFAIKMRDKKLIALLKNNINADIPLVELAGVLDLRLGKLIAKKSCMALLKGSESNEIK